MHSEGPETLIPLPVKSSGILWYGMALLWPWTGLSWRTFGIPSAVLLLILALILISSRAWQFCGLKILKSFNRLDGTGSKRAIALFTGLFFLWLANIKLCQHFTYQTHFADLGQDANVCWNTLHGRFFFDSIWHRNFLGDHFEPVLALCSVGFLFLEQCRRACANPIFSDCIAIFPLYALSRIVLKHKSLSFVVVILFIANAYLHMISAYEFHPESIFIPAAFLALYFWNRAGPGSHWRSRCLALESRKTYLWPSPASEFISPWILQNTRLLWFHANADGSRQSRFSASFFGWCYGPSQVLLEARFQFIGLAMRI